MHAGVWHLCPMSVERNGLAVEKSAAPASSPCIWYVAKYVAPPPEQRRGARGYGIMREIAKRGFNAVIITSDTFRPWGEPPLDVPYRVVEQDGLTFCQIHTKQYQDTMSLDRILSFLHFEWGVFRLPKKNLPRPDVVVVSSLSLLTVLSGLALSRRYGARFVFEVCDIWPLSLVALKGFSPKHPVVKALGWIEKLGYRKADAVIGTMPNLAEHVNAVIGSGTRVYCVPMGLEGAAAESKPEAAKDVAWDLVPHDRFLVSYAGSIGISNALDPLFECAESLKSEPGIHFLIMGDGPMRSSYVERFGDLPNLTFLPRVPESAVQSVLERSDLLAFSAHENEIWRYGQSLNKLIDYMLSGRPIVASYTGYESMINEAGCGTFVPAGDVDALRDEIVRYSQMPASEREAMGNRGLKWLLANRTYDKLADVFLEAAMGGSTSASRRQYWNPAEA